MATTETVQKLLVDGEWYETGETIDVTSPFDGSVVGRVAYGGADDARRAIDAAERAMRQPLPAHKRAAVLDRVAELIAERRDDFARTIAEEAGKPITTAGVEVDRCVQTITFSALEARRLSGEMVGMDAHPAGEGKEGLILRLPVGIIGAISPFNFPLNLVAHKVGPAFAAGCAVVLKPAGATPLSALLLAQAFQDAGQPGGWLNVIVGKSRDIGDVLTEDARVKMITFTGSSEVGWGIRQRANKKKVSLELGNSTPVIVLADADLDRAAGAIALNGYAFAGQSCISVQRVYVEDSVHDALMERLVPKVEALKVGDPLDPDTQVGPVIDAENRDRIKAWIDEAVSQGAKLAAGGELDDGGLLRPTLLDEVSLDMKVSCNEVFGPVVTVARVSGLDQAIEMANGTIYGLQAGVFTTNLPAAMRAARELEFGGVTLNEAPTFRADQMPYGGVKESGNTREGPRFAVQEMTEPRMVVIQL
ncbi:MAG: aldehyde dehydrogenase family protein [Gaiellales bacterium]|jgi:acyl-CoA reductase-like NAD-dependent aldehyde dehydrogenase